MRVVTYREGDLRGVGSLSGDGERIVPFELDAAARAEGALALIRRAVAGERLEPTGTPIPIQAVTLQAPIPVPARNVFCVGKNYRDHVQEIAQAGLDTTGMGDQAPAAPVVFSKLPQCVIGPEAPIRIDPAVSTAVDYEAELAVVIGRGGRNIAADRAPAHIWGYTIVNDVTARDIQRRHRQWLLGKSQDTFCPMGPWVVTAEELDASDLQLRCWVNGELRQQASTTQLLFDIPTLIATISRGITLLPGDIIATGTPAGVGAGFDPPRYLRDGDRVRIEIAGIGVLMNPVVGAANGAGSKPR